MSFVRLGIGLAGWAILSLGAALRAQDDAKDEIVVVKAGRILTVSGEDIKDGIIVIRNGKIEAVGTAVDYPYGAKVIDAKDLTVAPGFINPFSRAMPLAGAGPATKFGETFEADPEAFKGMVQSGYTVLGLAPTGMGIAGRSLILRTYADDSKGLIVTDEGPLAAGFNNPAAEKQVIIGLLKQAQAEIDKVEKARKDWEAKKKAADEAAKKAAEEAAKKGPTPVPGPQPAVPDKFVPPPINPALQPLVDLLQNKAGSTVTVEIGANPYNMWGGGTIMGGGIYLHWTDVTKDFSFAHGFVLRNPNVETDNPFVVFPETDAVKVTGEMGKEKRIVAIYPNVNHHPFTKDKYNLGLKLHQAGCRVVYLPEREGPGDYANMLGNLARMVKAGFPKREALKTVTLNAADLLGLGARFGSIQAGRDAHLVFLTGDPLSYDTRVAKVMIDGKIVPVKPRLN